MPLGRSVAALAAALLGTPVAVQGVTVRVENPTGDVRVRVSATEKLQYRASSPVRATRSSDIQVHQQQGQVTLDVQPADGSRVDVEVDLPYGLALQARTKAGALHVEGFLASASLITETGDVLLRMPWSATRILVRAREEPEKIETPRGYKFEQGFLTTGRWALRDKLPEMKITYGLVSLEADKPSRLALEDEAIPPDFPVKLPWQAPDLVDEILAGRKSRKPAPAPAPPESGGNELTREPGLPVFSSDVRVVNLAVAVTDRKGNAITDLQPADFEVLEDGKPQEVTFAGSEKVPFNLALLLDLSGSTRRDRPAMKEAAKRFVGIARPQDKVALYALADNMFYVVSPLTADRDRLADMIEAIPEVSGGSPLYDCIALAFGEEFLDRPMERNAIIVISDGVDNQIYGEGAASKVPFRKLRRAAEEWNALIYPIFLDPYTVAPAPGYVRRARAQMQELADASGGKLFPAQSIRDLDPVYPQVAEELRSVYTVAYYPKNQNFDGRWRRVKVRVKRPRAKVRTRDGYFAR